MDLLFNIFSAQDKNKIMAIINNENAIQFI